MAKSKTKLTVMPIAPAPDFNSLKALAHLQELLKEEKRLTDELTEVKKKIAGFWGELRQSFSSHLSAREEQVIGLIRQRKSNKEIASEIHVSERTVKFHVSQALKKFGFSYRTDFY